MEVVRRGRRVARGVVVDEDDARCVPTDRVAEQLADPDEAGRHVAAVDRDDPEHDVLRVQDHHAQLLGLQAAHLEHKAIRNVMRSADLPVRSRPVRHEPSPELEGGLQLRRARRPDTRQLPQFMTAGPCQSTHAVQAGKRRLREVHRAPAAQSRAPDECDQLGRREPAGPAQLEPLPGPFADRHLPQRQRLLHRTPHQSRQESPGPDDESPPIPFAIRARERCAAYAETLTWLSSRTALRLTCRLGRTPFDVEIRPGCSFGGDGYTSGVSVAGRFDAGQGRSRSR
jgi:hypothetical protein